MANKTLKFEIAGTVYTEKQLKSLLHKQLELKYLEEYSNFRGCDIDFMFENKNGDVFFELYAKDGEDMAVKIGQDDRIYWKWEGEIFE